MPNTKSVCINYKIKTDEPKINCHVSGVLTTTFLEVDGKPKKKIEITRYSIFF